MPITHTHFPILLQANLAACFGCFVRQRIIQIRFLARTTKSYSPDLAFALERGKVYGF